MLLAVFLRICCSTGHGSRLHCLRHHLRTLATMRTRPRDPQPTACETSGRIDSPPPALPGAPRNFHSSRKLLRLKAPVPTTCCPKAIAEPSPHGHRPPHLTPPSATLSKPTESNRDIPGETSLPDVSTGKENNSPHVIPAAETEHIQEYLHPGLTPGINLKGYRSAAPLHSSAVAAEFRITRLRPAPTSAPRPRRSQTILQLPVASRTAPATEGPRRVPRLENAVMIPNAEPTRE